ncbi:protein AF-10-like [Adelges cooleyi]|uniref:protein AF-10-like n=1 Tax=Adelges cooleyi TaxID=133065 RepID=UPI00218053B9|nr:protein AF-10-like [Adelges cooleyi]
MKEMLGNCSVCSEDKAYDGNPLVYCDGRNCNVAVHKACYGIRVVPKGSWYCSKCVAIKKNPGAKVICELCPSKDGALKPTESGHWAHVVCALFIPEVTFLDVDTMEPIKLNEIPVDRYKKVCYICEEKNREPKVSSYGACMTCKKSGCKLGFHVTCAQNVGLLCEEAGNYGRNVQYVGYCKHHYSKLKKSNNIKIKHIAPYRPQNASEITLDEFSQEKLTSNVDSDGQIKSKRKYGNYDDSKEKPPSINGHPNQQTVSNRQYQSKTENVSVGSIKQYTDETKSDKTIKCENTNSSMEVNINNDASDTLKIIEEPNLSNINSNLPAVTLTNTWIKEPSITNVISTQSTPNVVKATSDQKFFEPIADAPHMLGNSLNPNSTMAQQMTDTLNEEIQTHNQFSEINGPVARQTLTGPHLNRHKPTETFQSNSSSSEWFTNGIGSSAQSLEDLLERQWEQGGSLLMEQAQHFDVASLLSCLYQLKNENIGLEKELATFTRRRDHLLAVNARLAIPLIPQNRTNPVATSSSHIETTMPPRSNYLPSMDNQIMQQQHRYHQSLATHSSRHQQQHRYSPNVSAPSQVIVRGGHDSWEQHSRNQMSLSSPLYQTSMQDLQNISTSRHQTGMESLPKHS